MPLVAVVRAVQLGGVKGNYGCLFGLLAGYNNERFSEMRIE